MTVLFGDTRMPGRFWMKVTPGDNGCWNFTGAKGKGYGQFWLDGGLRLAHRVAYEALVGPIPADLVVDHLCRNRPCCNPRHMEITSNGENVLRGDGPPAHNARKTHCIHGHELAGSNLVPNKRGRRLCRECKRAADVRHAARQKELALAS